MSNLEILSPQPSRPLKRKASQLIELCEDTSSNRKRQKSSVLPRNPIHNWLEKLPPPMDRCCSDSFLLRDINQGQHGRSNEVQRSRTTPLETGDTPIPWPSTPQSLQATTKPDTPSSATHCAAAEVSGTLESSSQSSAPASCSQSDESKNSKNSKKSNRVASPSYRDELQNHCVHIDSFGNSTPGCVREVARSLLDKARSSPDLTQEELLSVRKELSTLSNADEGVTRKGLDATRLFPTTNDYDDKIAIGSSIPFDSTGLPFTRGMNFKPIVTPKPDLHYGYPRAGFTMPEAGVMQHSRLSALSHPTTATYWPFFVVEFKAGSRGGTRWVAQNQNAGTGSLLVNSMETLLNYTREQGVPRKTIDSVVFSCVAEADLGSLWVHWQEAGTDNGSLRFVSSQVESYSFEKLEDLRLFRKGVRNIIDEGIDERLARIKQALADCVPLIPKWNAEDRLAKVRRRAS